LPSAIGRRRYAAQSRFTISRTVFLVGELILDRVHAEIFVTLQSLRHYALSCGLLLIPILVWQDTVREVAFLNAGRE
jgi:hypothetical protein